MYKLRPGTKVWELVVEYGSKIVEMKEVVLDETKEFFEENLLFHPEEKYYSPFDRLQRNRFVGFVENPDDAYSRLYNVITFQEPKIFETVDNREEIDGREYALVI